jgi:hypothetical protein
VLQVDLDLDRRRTHSTSKSLWHMITKDVKKIYSHPSTRKLQLSMQLLSVSILNMYYLGLYNSS